MSRLIIFDDGLGHLGPMTDLRAAFEVRTGMLTTAERIAAAWPKSLAGYWVAPRLLPLVASRADAPVNRLPDEEVLLCLNGRWALPDPAFLGGPLRVGEAMLEEASGHVIAAVLRRADAEYFLATQQLHERVEIRLIGKRVLYKYPWDVQSLLKMTIAHDILAVRILDARIPDGAATVGRHPIEVHATASIYPNVVLDAENGPIAVHAGATVRPGAVLCGPCSVGPHSTVIDRALIKASTAVGPHCKVGGEVGASVFQGYSNKSHDGHLGDSWVGEWVNVGAGTTNSNLLNTYGEVTVRLDPHGPRQRTGMTFLGAVIGDHVKLAIGTRIMTGSVIGTGAMIATTTPPPTTVKPFAWLTDDGEREFGIDKFLEVARAMMLRRHVALSAPYEAALRALQAEAAGSVPAR
jgi:UDP-N-acetylglucosamine diphosphorylase/glucosamine-1-phosphate N-acetyltransferase